MSMRSTCRSSLAAALHMFGALVGMIAGLAVADKARSDCQRCTDCCRYYGYYRYRPYYPYWPVPASGRTPWRRLRC